MTKKPSVEEHRAMLEMLEGLTPEERKMLKDPDFISEDEADVIVCHRRANEPTCSLDELLADAGIPRRQQRA